MIKTQLRQRLKKIRVNVDKRKQKNLQILERFFLLIAASCSQHKSVFIYESFGSEADTKDIIERLVIKGYRVFVPKVNADFSMRAVDKVTGEFAEFAPEITVVPLLGFNQTLHRIGYGKGCYDKYFAQSPNTVKIGLSFNEQFCGFLPDSHDVPLDYCVTPMLIYAHACNCWQI